LIHELKCEGKFSPEVMSCAAATHIPALIISGNMGRGLGIDRQAQAIQMNEPRRDMGKMVSQVRRKIF
jgi:hypothetical protein